MKPVKPSKFHKKLEALAGDWSGDEVLFPSPWMPEGGKAKGSWKGKAIVGGMAVAQDYEQRIGGKSVFTGHGVFGYDPEQKCYVWHWSDSMSGVPCGVTKGEWRGNKIVWRNATPMGHGRYTHTFLRGGKLGFLMESSPDGEQWTKFMEGVYTKKAKKGARG